MIFSVRLKADLILLVMLCFDGHAARYNCYGTSRVDQVLEQTRWSEFWYKIGMYDRSDSNARKAKVAKVLISHSGERSKRFDTPFWERFPIVSYEWVLWCRKRGARERDFTIIRVLLC